MTTFYRIAANSIQADEDRRAMAVAGLGEIRSTPYDGIQGSRYLTIAKGSIKPGVVLPVAKLQ